MLKGRKVWQVAKEKILQAKVSTRNKKTREKLLTFKIAKDFQPLQVIEE